MIKIVVLAILGFIAASMLATWLYGHFAASVQGEPSHALPIAEGQTALDRRIGEATAARPGQSGLLLLDENLDAFAARGISARLAERSLDLLYYIWNDDLTGRLLMAEILEAALRGVRVRLLVDDLGTGHSCNAMSAMAHHPRIEIRIFNPTRARPGSLRRGVEMALRSFSVTRRMHNKAWIADGRIAILGGRNIGDAYFDAAESTNFRDMDVLVMGPAVALTEKIFDDYWNSGLALPADKLSPLRDPDAMLAQVVPELAATAARPDARAYLDRITSRIAMFEPGESQADWTLTARVIADPPEKALGKKGENWLMRELLPVFATTQQRIEITSPYFIPGEEGTTALAGLTARGIAVSILTNSLAATDVAAVHGGYAPYRVPLLKAGIKLWELRPEARGRKLSLRGSSSASLHTKAFTADGQRGFIGSMNFDPRSASLNTEMGVVFDCPTIAAKMEAVWHHDTAPDHSFAVSLTPQGALQWHASDDGKAVTYDRDPEASFWRRLTARVVGWLPLESQL